MKDHIWAQAEGRHKKWGHRSDNLSELLLHYSYSCLQQSHITGHLTIPRISTSTVVIFFLFSTQTLEQSS